jgi:hypothetical protein
VLNHPSPETAPVGAVAEAVNLPTTMKKKYSISVRTVSKKSQPVSVE